ncbi:hypothetical protein SO802_024832 [Lithocarpus litseifolius]|uniref:DDHD domain-containing protein n=1 Tax=Lithocarpus litseifolius TaxID=425828 RepID=A0AAW2CDB7_9ROSI
MDSKQPGGEKDVDELLCDSSDILSQKRDALSETKNMDSGIQIEGLEKMTEDMCEDEGNKNKAIKLLKKETKIVELEKQCGGGDTRFSNLHIKISPFFCRRCPLQRRRPREADDTFQTTTPSYTKLEFKVDTFFAVGSPLGVFLALRNIRIGIGIGKEYWEEENISEEMPACRQMLTDFTRLILWHTEAVLVIQRLLGCCILGETSQRRSVPVTKFSQPRA